MIGAEVALPEKLWDFENMFEFESDELKEYIQVTRHNPSILPSDDMKQFIPPRKCCFNRQMRKL